MFRKTQKQTQSDKVDYPTGTFIHTEAGYFYIVSPTTRYRLISKRVLDSWKPHRVVETTEAAVAAFKVYAKMKFRNGSLLYSQASGSMYLVSDNKLRHITNPDWLTRLGARRADAVWVSLNEINLHEKGEPLN